MILTTLVLGALISSSLTDAYGNTNLPSEKPSKITKVTFDEVNLGDRLYIKDSYGQTLYSEKIKTDGSYTKRFDLSKLSEDEYYFELDKADALTILPFNVGREIISLKKESKTDIAKPQLEMQKHKVKLTRDVEGAQSLTIKVYYEGRDLAYSEDIDKVGKLVREYDFSTSLPGEYLFYINYEDRVFTKYVYVL